MSKENTGNNNHIKKIQVLSTGNLTIISPIFIEGLTKEAGSTVRCEGAGKIDTPEGTLLGEGQSFGEDVVL